MIFLQMQQLMDSTSLGVLKVRQVDDITYIANFMPSFPDMVR